MNFQIFKHIIIVLVSSIAIVSCSDTYSYGIDKFKPSLSAHFIRPSQTEFTSLYLPDAINETFKVESYETPWAFKDVPQWIRLTPMSGNRTTNVNLFASTNNQAEARTAIFYLTSTTSEWYYNKAMSVSQGAAKPYITVDTNSLSFEGGANSQTVTVTSNCNWIAKTSASWISLAKSPSGTLTISVSPNTLTSYRNATVSLNFGSISEYIAVTQTPADVKTSQTFFSCDNVATKYNITLTSDADWTATPSHSWISVNPNSGVAGQTEMSIEIAPNTSTQNRVGYIQFSTSGTKKHQIEIRQKGLYIEADEELEFTSVESTQPLTIYSNTNWSILSAPNWVSLSNTAGEGTDVVTVSVQDNPNTSIRSGEIVVGQLGLDLKAIVKVNQIGKSFTTNTSVIEMSDKSGSATFDIISDASWTSSISDNWFSISPLMGTGNAQIEVVTTENRSAEERTGTISYKYVDKVANVNIHQLAKYMTIDNKTFEFDSKGGSHTIEIMTNDKWTAEIEHDATWLKLSNMSGNGSETITLTVEDNPSVNIRSTTIVINTECSQSVKILVTQKPRQLSVNTQSILFYADGGPSAPIVISTDGVYEISNDATWFTINKTENNTFSVYATKNTTNELRKGKVKISLTDLVEGSLSLEMEVIQPAEGGSFVVGGYCEDVNWGTINCGSISLTIANYITDSNWDNLFGGSLSLNITGFTTDYDWNRLEPSNGYVSITNFGNDVAWEGYSGNGNISNNGYGNDNDWNKNNNGNIGVTINGYSDAQNWNNN